MATCTPWNSHLTMMRSVLRVSPEVWDKLNTPYKLKQYELNTIKELCDILEPFEYVTNQIQGQNMVTSSLVVNCVRGLRAALAIATLDPRYKLDWCHDYDNEVQDIRDVLTVKYNMAGSVDPTTTDTSPAEPPTMKRNKFFVLANRSSTPRPTPSETEVSLYLKQPCLQGDGDPLGYWKAKQPEFAVCCPYQTCSKIPGHSCYIGSCGTTVLHCWQALQAR
ncbi:hypothetical protein Hamer_G025176, partial [Homarus americanus]